MPPRSSSPICERSLDLTLIGIGRRDIPQCSPKHFLMEVFCRTFSGGRRPRGLPGREATTPDPEGSPPAPHSGKPQTEHRAEFYGAAARRKNAPTNGGRPEGTRPGRLRYGAATKCLARIVAAREETNG